MWSDLKRNKHSLFKLILVKAVDYGEAEDTRSTVAQKKKKKKKSTALDRPGAVMNEEEKKYNGLYCFVTVTSVETNLRIMLALKKEHQTLELDATFKVTKNN